jgi:RNA methyltransferase, TrmH family
MPGRNTIKFIASLKQKKNRQQHRLFIIEGEKMVDELTASVFEIHSVYATEEWLGERLPGASAGNLPVKGDGSFKVVSGRSGSKSGYSDQLIEKSLFGGRFPLFEIKEQDLSRISGLNSPNKVLAVVHFPEWELAPPDLANSLSLVLDNIQDPGNLGTLIRTAHWFGIENIILSGDSAEFTNPKVVQATMGSVLHVKTHYTDLHSFLKSPGISGLPVYGAFPEAPDIYSVPLSDRGLIVLGNESRGISEQLETFITQKMSIPSFRGKGKSPESLNVAVAGSIIVSEFRRRYPE